MLFVVKLLNILLAQILSVPLSTTADLFQLKAKQLHNAECGSSNADDPQAATRGVRGASAVALGRRIMQGAGAKPEMKRHGSVGHMGQLSTRGSLLLLLSIQSLLWYDT